MIGKSIHSFKKSNTELVVVNKQENMNENNKSSASSSQSSSNLMILKQQSSEIPRANPGSVIISAQNSTSSLGGHYSLIHSLTHPLAHSLTHCPPKGESVASIGEEEK